MEPISKKIQRVADTGLIGFFSLFVLIPLIFSLYRNLLDLDFAFLSPLFFWILLKATAFAFLQASLSVLTIAAFSFFIVSYFKKRNLDSKSKRTLELCGFLGFSLSPTLVALSIILSFSSIFQMSPSGLAAIVFCHFIMNAAYFSSQFWKRSERYDAAEGSLLREYVRSLGVSPTQEQKLLLWPLFKNDFGSWAPQIFLWCFMSFAPIVLLSSGRGQNTPELLLYYSLLNDPSGSRVFVIFLLTATISFLLTRFAYSDLRKKNPETFVHDHKTKISWGDLALYAVSLCLVFPFLFTLLSPIVEGVNLSKDLLGSLFPTALIFVSSFFISLLFGVFSLLASKEHKLISYCTFLSAPMVLMGFLALDLPQGQSYFWISFGAFLALLPWAHRRIRTQVEALSTEHRETALSLGMKNFSYFRFYLWPEMGPSVLKLSLLFSLWSLGEYTFSKAFLDRSATLALFIEEKLRRYQFSEASSALSLTLLLSVIVVTPLLWKGRSKG